jgi:outer membrane usher protein
MIRQKIGYGSIVFGASVCCNVFAADQVVFDSALLWGEMRAGDVSKYEVSNPAPVGKQVVELKLNERSLGKEQVIFSVKNKNMSSACLDERQIKLLALKEEVVLPDFGAGCVSLEQLDLGGDEKFDFSEQTLSLSIPQKFLREVPLDYIDPSLFDDGISAARLNYSFSGYVSDAGKAGKTMYDYLGLDGGINISGWRIRHSGSYSVGDGIPRNYTSLRTYAQHDIFASRARFTIGQMLTSGQFLDSYSIVGAGIDSEQRSLPGSQMGFVPVIEGVAQSNAQVVVSQVGVVIYTRTVPPGPFSLNDLSGARYGTDLDVQIVEANGSKRTFSVPYNSSVQLLRPGSFRFSSNIGQYDDQGAGLSYKPVVGQLSGLYGVNNIFTGYSGIIASESYQSATFGGSMSTGIGAITADVSAAKTSLAGVNEVGSSLKLAYSAYMPPTKTSLNIATYRYSTKGYWSFSDAVQQANYNGRYLSNEALFGRPVRVNQKSRFDISLHQGLPVGWGAFSVGASRTNYWGSDQVTTNFRAGWSDSWRGASIGAYLGRDMRFGYGNQVQSDTLTFTFSMPLGGAGRQSISGSTQRTSSGSAYQVGLNGNAGEQQQINYGVYTSRNVSSGGATSSNLSTNASYASGVGLASAGVSTSQNYRQYSLGFNGGVLAHENGVSFSQTLGETVALLDAKDAGGASIINAAGAKIGRNGIGVVPYLSPYRRNRITIDPIGLPYDMELVESSTEVIPSAGAVIWAHLETQPIERTYFIQLMDEEGRPLPFGSEVLSTENNKAIGDVGQYGRAIVAGLAEQGEFIVRASHENCTFTYLRDDESANETSNIGSAKTTARHCQSNIARKL